MPILSKRALSGLKAYKYVSAGYTLLDDIHQPFWNCEPPDPLRFIVCKHHIAGLVRGHLHCRVRGDFTTMVGSQSHHIDRRFRPCPGVLCFTVLCPYFFWCAVLLWTRIAEGLYEDQITNTFMWTTSYSCANKARTYYVSSRGCATVGVLSERRSRIDISSPGLYRWQASTPHQELVASGTAFRPWSA